MTLQATTRYVANPDVATRIGGVIDELDTTISEIRSTIFSLERHRAAAGSLRVRVLEVADAMAGPLGHDPVVHFDGPVDAAASGDLADAVVAVVREALSNVTRHARASASRVEVSAGDELVVHVVDNGIGIGAPSRRSGVLNLERRAAAAGGRFAVGDRPGGGTELTWRVPLPTRTTRDT
jgi:signal transduction histidine kinase